MKLRIVPFLFLLMCNLQLIAQNDQDVLDYIEKYKTLAIEEQVRIGVPASITLAQGIHESTAGKSELAVNGNNHFGIKCKSTWTGDTILHDDDKRQECFRKYISPEQSYIDHSDFLKGSNRYSFLFDLEVTDYIGWASGLKRAGYATNPAYVRRLTDLVEKYNLQQYTYEAQKKKFATVGEVIPDKDNTSNFNQAQDPNIFYKGLKGFWAKKGDLLLDKSVMNNIRYQRLLDINDLPDAPLENDMFLFVEKKRKTGTVEFHVVKDNETMQLISQKEAILLEYLYAYNNMQAGQEPETGEQLSLQYKAYGTPRLKPMTITSTPTPTETKPTETVVSNEPVKEQPKEVNNPIPVKVEETKVVVQQETEKTAPIQEPIKVEVAKSSNPDIIDLDKARRTEALLAGNKPVETPITKSVPTKEPEKLVQVTYGNTPKIEEVKHEPIPVKEEPKIVKEEPKKEIPQAPKRTYNEPGVSESVKVLKQRFDEAVYRPLPEPKKVDPIPTEVKPVAPKVEPKATTPPNKVTKPETKTTDDTKKPTPKVETKITEGKNAKVEQTKTGIVREVKKADPKKDIKTETKKVDAKKTTKSSDEKLNSKTKQTKEVTKKVDTKKPDSKKKETTNKKPEPKKKK